MSQATGRGLLGAMIGACLIAGSGCSVTKLQKDLNTERQRSQQLLRDRFDLERDLNVSKGLESSLRNQIADLTVAVQTLRGEARRPGSDAIDIIPIAGADSGEVTPAVASERSGPTGFESLSGSGVASRWEQDGTLRVTLPDGLFGAGQAQLSSKGKQLVAGVVAQWSGRFSGGQVVVEGHTDNTPVSKVKAVFPSNWELSSARAGAVLRELVVAGKAAAGESFIVGYGPNRPIASNDSSAGRRANRRVEILIQP